MTTTTETTEHPIIFNDWSIRRILAGEKMQTRRIVKPQPQKDNCVELDENTVRHITDHLDECPYGQPGDVLWVREAFRLPATCEDESPSDYVTRRQKGRYDMIVRYGADGHEERPKYIPGYDQDEYWGRLRPSIHMPRELCRIRLRVEDVGVERIRDIGAEDAIAEGIPDPYTPDVMPDDLGSVDLDPERRTIQELAFKALWNSIHGPGAWERSDWAWKVTFSVIEPDLT